MVACLAIGTLWAQSEQSDPLVGKWKLDPTKSRITDMMRVEAAGGNKYALIFNTGDFEPIVADGTDQPASFGSTVSITVASPDNWKVVRKKNGKIQLIGNWNLSDDGKTLTDAFSSTKANGEMSVVNYVYKRTAPGSGFVGTWESESDTVTYTFEFQIAPYEGDGFTLISPGGTTKNMKFDGKDYPIQGQYVFPGTVASGRRVNERTVEVTDKTNGRVVDKQHIELSPDLKTLTITSHPAGQSKANVFAFDRE
jgi:hypothetical protein